MECSADFSLENDFFYKILQFNKNLGITLQTLTYKFWRLLSLTFINSAEFV